MDIHKELINDLVNPLMSTAEGYIMISRSITEKTTLVDLIGKDVFRILKFWISDTKNNHPLPTVWMILGVLSGITEHLRFSLPDNEVPFVESRIINKLNDLFAAYLSTKIAAGEYQFCNNHPTELMHLSLTRGIVTPNEIEFIDLNQYISISSLQRFDITETLNTRDGVCAVCRNLQFIGGTKNA